MLDVEKFVGEFHDYIGRALRPIGKRLEALEARQLEKGDPGKDGRDGVDGKSVSIDELRSVIVEEVQKIPVPKDGIDGKSVPIDEVRSMVLAEVAKIPAPINGTDGRDGERGEKGEPGDRGIAGLDGKDAEPLDMEVVRSMVVEEVSKIPIPKDGEQGEKGDSGENGKDADQEAILLAVTEKALQAVEAIPRPRDGTDGKDADESAILATVTQKALQAVAEIPRPTDGVNGKDGSSVTLDDVRPLLESELSKWALDFERRAAGVLERAVERIPRPKDGEPGTNGKDGADGFGFDDFDVEYDGKRTFTFKWTHGERVKSKEFDVPVHIYQGVYKKTESYAVGDSVTYGGSLWVAMQDKPHTTPGDGQAWKLAVKRGSDAK